MKKLAYLLLVTVGTVYTVSPVDFVPDVLPPFTYGDDAIVDLICIVIMRYISKR